MPFNVKQQQALNLSIDDDALIAAAAGSGKTKVLSERVYNLIKDGKLKPSELLVLTFTNNAAHEMKTRIINNFKENGKIALSEEMKSCHIQTFDSFSKYLVTKYSSLLGIASTISIVDETIFDLKRTSFLNDVIDEYYNNEFDRTVNIFKKYCSNGDTVIKKIILDIDKKLAKMSDVKRNNILNNYNDLFLSKNKFDELFKEYIDYYKDYIIDTLLYLNFKDLNYDLDNMNPSEIEDLLNDKSNFTKSYDELTFAYDFTQECYNEILKMLKLDSYDFLRAVKAANNNPLFDTKAKHKYTSDKEEAKYYTKIHKELCGLFQKNANAYPKLNALINLENPNDLYNIYCNQKDSIDLIIEIIKKIDEKILDYKKSSNSYTFLDISKFTNDLISNPKYNDAQDEIRSQFKYIMVDEYQDSNDFQEIMLDSLMKPNKDGKKAHLFCVGDVKQSIYAFRNSNVELFRGRQEKFKNSTDTHEKVIDMNLNYRSGKPLLEDINYLFDHYMTKDNGGIDYDCDEEKLHYDDKVDIYGEEYDDFGVHRIVSIGHSTKEWEACAILADIKKKIAEGFMVYDKKVGIRKCEYSDFAIITRTKSGFSMFQKLFYENNVPLNSKLPSYLTDVDAIITLQSLIALIDAIINKREADYNHLFMSLARSYIYELTDDEIDTIIRNKAVFKSQIMVDVDDFIKSHRNSEFDTIFLDALVKFKMLEKLNLVGDISDNVSKIESLYSLILGEKHIGEGISDFVELFKTVTKNKMDLKDEVNISLENAVDMMTIHASKGLERKIVYLPASYNVFGGSNSEKPDYEFSEECGFILNNYDIDPLNDVKTNTFLNTYNSMFSKQKKVDNDEFVRLMYVAFTRAENICYVVGKYKYSKGTKPNINKLYQGLPCYYTTDVEYLEKMMEKKIISEALVKEYYDSIQNIGSNIKTPASLNDYERVLFNRIYNFYLEKSLENHSNIVSKITSLIYDYYHELFEAEIENENYNLFAKLYSIYYGIPNVNTFDEFFKYMIKEYGSRMLGEDDEDEDLDDDDFDGKLPDDFDISLMENDEVFKVILMDFAKEFYSEEIVSLTQKEKDKPDLAELKITSALTPYYAYIFDNNAKYMVLSYAYGEFKDRIFTPDFSYLNNAEIEEPELNDDKIKVFDDELKFKERKKFRASINQASDDDISDTLEYGIYLHHLLELVDFKNIDTSFIDDVKAKEYIDKALKMPIFNDLANANIYKEYGYYDDVFDTTGFIDLMYEKDGIYYIIDYKSSDIEKEGYKDQLHTYQRNVMKLFNVDKDHIKLYLVSILNSEMKEIEVE